LPDNESGDALPIHTIGHAGAINRRVRALGVVAEKKVERCVVACVIRATNLRGGAVLLVESATPNKSLVPSSR